MAELSSQDRYTICAMQMNAYITAYSGLDVYIALYLDGRISLSHFQIMVGDVKDRLNEQKRTIEEMVGSLTDGPRARPGDTLPTE